MTSSLPARLLLLLTIASLLVLAVPVHAATQTLLHQASGAATVESPATKQERSRKALLRRLGNCITSTLYEAALDRISDGELAPRE